MLFPINLNEIIIVSDRAEAIDHYIGWHISRLEEHISHLWAEVDRLDTQPAEVVEQQALMPASNKPVCVDGCGKPINEKDMWAHIKGCQAYQIKSGFFHHS